MSYISVLELFFHFNYYNLRIYFRFGNDFKLNISIICMVDEIDRVILSQLGKNSRISSKEIAMILQNLNHHITDRAIRQRVHRLEKNNTIEMTLNVWRFKCFSKITIEREKMTLKTKSLNYGNIIKGIRLLSAMPKSVTNYLGR